VQKLETFQNQTELICCLKRVCQSLSRSGPVKKQTTTGECILSCWNKTYIFWWQFQQVIFFLKLLPLFLSQREAT